MNGKSSLLTYSRTSTLLTRQGGSFLDNHANNQPGHGGLGGTKGRGGCITCNRIISLQGKETCGHSGVWDFGGRDITTPITKPLLQPFERGSRGKQRQKAYQRKCQEFPIQSPPQELRDDLTTAFAALQATHKEPEAVKRHWHDWVSDETWLLIKQRTSLHRAGRLRRCVGQHMQRAIHASLKVDHMAHRA